MAQLYISDDDVLYRATVTYQESRRYGQYKNTISYYTEEIGPYVTTASLKGNITRFKKNHRYTNNFAVLDITFKKTELDWKETTI